MRKIYFIGCLLFATSCANVEQSSQEEQKIENQPSDTIGKTEAAFHSFLSKCPTLQLPLKRKINNAGLVYDGQYEVKPNSRYIQFFKNPNSYRLVGKILLSDDLIAVLSLYPADDMIPILNTYDQKGNLINDAFLVQRGCHADCGYRYCSSWLELDDELNMVLSDTLDYYECDQNGIEGKERHYFTLQTLGKVEKDGRIRFSEGETIDLK